MLSARLLAPLLMGALVLLFSSPAVAQESESSDTESTWTINTERSSIEFISDAPMERIVGNSDDIEGEVTFDSAAPSETSGEIKFPVDSLETGNSTRDHHLTQEDWLYAEQHPYIAFRIEGLEDPEVARSEDRLDFRGTAVGTLEVRGVEQPVEAQVEIAILPAQSLARVQPEFSIHLPDFEIPGRDNAVGREVGETIEIEGLLYANEE